MPRTRLGPRDDGDGRGRFQAAGAEAMDAAEASSQESLSEAILETPCVPLREALFTRPALARALP